MIHQVLKISYIIFIGSVTPSLAIGSSDLMFDCGDKEDKQVH